MCRPGRGWPLPRRAYPGARLVELPRRRSLPVHGRQSTAWWTRSKSSSPGLERPRRPLDRALATVLFTDIVPRPSAPPRSATALAATTRSARGGRRPRYSASRRRELKAPATVSCSSMALRAASAVLPRSADAVARLRLSPFRLAHRRCELFDDDIGCSIAVHIATAWARWPAPARCNSSPAPSRTSWSSSARIEFAPRGETQLKGIPGRWPLFSVGSAYALWLPSRAPRPPPRRSAAAQRSHGRADRRGRVRRAAGSPKRPDHPSLSTARSHRCRIAREAEARRSVKHRPNRHSARSAASHGCHPSPDKPSEPSPGTRETAWCCRRSGSR